MNAVQFLLVLCGAPLLVLFMVATKVVSETRLQRKAKKMRLETHARIVRLHRLNNTTRSIPFVKMTVEVFPGNGKGFLAIVESFCTRQELAVLRPGKVIRVWYNAAAQSSVQIANRANLINHELPTTRALPVYKPHVVRLAV